MNGFLPPMKDLCIQMKHKKKRFYWTIELEKTIFHIKFNCAEKNKDKDLNGLCVNSASFNQLNFP